MMQIASFKLWLRLGLKQMKLLIKELPKILSLVIPSSNQVLDFTKVGIKNGHGIYGMIMRYNSTFILWELSEKTLMLLTHYAFDALNSQSILYLNLRFCF